jgi:hypothetical protein
VHLDPYETSLSIVSVRKNPFLDATTNAIESLNDTLRRSVRVRGHFPNDEAAMKLIWRQLREITKNWKMPPRNGLRQKPNSEWCSVIGSRSTVNEPPHTTKFRTVSPSVGQCRSTSGHLPIISPDPALWRHEPFRRVPPELPRHISSA